MIRVILLKTVFLILTINLCSQPEIVWQKCFGGTSGEQFSEIKLTNNNEIIFTGSTSSEDGDVYGNHGESDYWIGMIDENGSLLWQKCLGGSKWDYGNSLDYCSDDSFIVAGQTDSNDGDITSFIGYIDYWVVKTDQSGNIEWEKCYGGSLADRAFAVKQTIDNGFIIAGFTNSNDVHVSGNHGEEDSWVVKTDSLGNIEWQKCLGGSDQDWANDISITNNGYYVLNYSESNDGDVNGNHGGHDFWIVKLDLAGNIIWQKSLGGSALDQGNSIITTNDGGCVAIGRTYSNDGDVSNNTGESDYWIIKLDSLANLEWEKCFGYDLNNSIDHGHDIQQTTDEGFIITGYSTVNTCFYSWDFWIIKLNSYGELEWEKCTGGTSQDFAYSITQDNYGNIYIGGNTRSNDGDVSGNHGWVDSWLIKLDDFTDIEKIDSLQSSSSPFPNPSSKTITIILNHNSFEEQVIFIYDFTGAIVESLKFFSCDRIRVDVSSYRKGLYFYKSQTDTSISGRFIKK